MEQHRPKSVLFLCTGNYYRSRFAEILFNSVAGKMGLPWRASSRGLALERGVNNIGPIAPEALQALTQRGLRAPEECTRLPVQVTTEDLNTADLIIALKETEHRPLLRERFPAWAERVEHWHINDAPEALALIETEVMDLMARLLGGRKQQTGTSRESASEESSPRTKKTGAASAPVVRVGRETKGRRGKGVTIISDLPLDETSLRELAARLKQRCGTGGTVRDGHIEIQGDQRDRLIPELESLGYRVKRAGG